MASHELVIGEGETLVIDEDTHWDLAYLDIEGTLVIDGAMLYIHSSGELVLETCINVSGSLRIVNGGALSGNYMTRVRPGGIVEVTDSTISGGYYDNWYTFDLTEASMSMVNSSITTPGFVHAKSSNVTLRDSTVIIDGNREGLAFLDITKDSSLLVEDSTIQGHQADGALLHCSRTANVSVSGSDLWSPSGILVYVAGAESLTFAGTAFRQGQNGLRVDDVGHVTLSDVSMEGQSGCACNLSWLGALEVNGLTIEDCNQVAINITNSSNVYLTDVLVSGVGGRGVGVLTQYCDPLTVKAITVKYAQKGIYMIYTDNVDLEDVSVDWCRRYGLQSSFCDGVTIDGLTATCCGIDGIYFACCKNVRVSNGDLDGAEECGAFLTHSPVSMTNVSARRCGTYGIRAAMHSTFLVGCDLSFNGREGLFSLDQGGVGLSGCTVVGNDGNGTRFLNAQSPWVKGSRIADNGDAGIWVHYSTQGAEVHDCDLEGNRFGVVLNGPTSLSWGSSVKLRDSYIHNNTEAGAFNWLTNTSNASW